MIQLEISKEDFLDKEVDLKTNKLINKLARMKPMIARPVMSLRHYLNKFIKRRFSRQSSGSEE
jgi:hypothetical protein